VQPPPLVVSRRFVLPASITALAAVATRHGMTPPHVLLGTAGEGLLALDRRLVDPRRPGGEPSEAEKAEGLARYAEVLPLRHGWLLSHAHALPRLAALVSAPSDFESTALVAAVGLDDFCARTAPARGFDMLDASFNVGYFVAVILGCAAGTAALRHYALEADLQNGWK